jgi:hypothetical protein
MTRYDVVSALMIALVAGAAVAVGFLVMIWFTNLRPETSREQEVLFVDNPGGFLDGHAGETLGGPDGPPADIADIQSSEEMANDPVVEETELEDVNFQETVDSVVSAVGVQPAAQLVPTNPINVGEKNEGVRRKVKGTGKKPLGDGPGIGGFGREQRWFVEFASGGTLDEYAKQLDFFKIELAAYFSGGKLTYISNMSQAQPAIKNGEANESEKRLYMTWKSGGAARRAADVQLFKKAGVDASDALILHFYAKETEQLLSNQETKFRGRPSKEILRTYFTVRPDGAGGYNFVVTRQTYVS